MKHDDRLVADDGGKSRTLYLEERSESRVLLSEYLEAFINLNRAGINVAFVEAVK